MTKELRELANKAKQAQREYDTAKSKDDSLKQKVGEDTIVAKSNAEGFGWNCNATAEHVVKHTVATITSAFESLRLNKDSDGEILLSIGILEAIQEVTKNDSSI